MCPAHDLCVDLVGLCVHGSVHGFGFRSLCSDLFVVNAQALALTASPAPARAAPVSLRVVVAPFCVCRRWRSYVLVNIGRGLQTRTSAWSRTAAATRSCSATTRSARAPAVSSIDLALLLTFLCCACCSPDAAVLNLLLVRHCFFAFLQPRARPASTAPAPVAALVSACFARDDSLRFCVSRSAFALLLPPSR